VAGKKQRRLDLDGTAAPLHFSSLSG